MKRFIVMVALCAFCLAVGAVGGALGERRWGERYKLQFAPGSIPVRIDVRTGTVEMFRTADRTWIVLGQPTFEQ